MSTGRKRKSNACNGSAQCAEADRELSQVASEKTFVHRCRFVDWVPESIDAMTCNFDGNKLAVARSDGTIEVWQMHSDTKWEIDSIIAGSKDCQITSMWWSTQHQRRLFVTSLNGTLWEVDVSLLLRKRIVDSNGGPIWCSGFNETKQQLAIGCEDGRVRLFSIADDDLHFYEGFVSTSKRIVSLSWHIEKNLIYTGSEDGIIYRWNATTGRNESRITLDTVANNHSVVWSLLVLQDDTLVSGDSFGNLCFWDGETGTLLQKFTHLTADILTLCTDSKNSVLYASGVDAQVAEYRSVTDASDKCLADRRSWKYSYSNRAHSHDVRALAIAPIKSADEKHFGRLFSGGLDTQLISYRINTFHTHRPWKMPSMPYRGTFALSSEKRILLMQKARSLDLWQLSATASAPEVGALQETLALQLNISGNSNVTCSSISSDGQYIACATVDDIKLFRLPHNGQYSPEKIVLSDVIARNGARALAFSPDSMRLVVATTSAFQLHVVDLKRLEIVQSYFIEEEDVVIQMFKVSNDAQWLAVLDTHNRLTVLNLDTMQLHCQLSLSHEKMTNFGFNPPGSLLMVTVASDSLVVYDLESKSLSDWSRSNVRQLEASEFRAKLRHLKGVALRPNQPNTAYLYSQSSLAKIDMSTTGNGNKQAKKFIKNGKENIEEDPSFCTTINQFRPVAYAEFLTSKELVVVETPWLKYKCTEILIEYVCYQHYRMPNGMLSRSTIEEHLSQRLPSEYRITTDTIDYINECVTEFVRITAEEANRLAELGASKEQFRVQESHLITAANNLALHTLLPDVESQRQTNRQIQNTKRKRDRAKMSGSEELIVEQKKLFELASNKAKSEGWQ
ncbi:hypothetical protein ABG067_006615 [Albugo candida]